MYRHTGTAIPSGRHRSVSTTHMTVWRRVVLPQRITIRVHIDNYLFPHRCLLIGRVPVTVPKTIVKRLVSPQKDIIQCVTSVKAELWKPWRGKIVSVADFLIDFKLPFQLCKTVFCVGKNGTYQKKNISPSVFFRARTILVRLPCIFAFFLASSRFSW